MPQAVKTPGTTCDMARCPDCDGPRITPGFDLGDGKCKRCHGTGESVFGAIASALVPIDPERSAAKCDACDGSGICQMCKGSGEI